MASSATRAGPRFVEPPPHVRPDARDVAGAQAALLAAVELERQRALQDDVDLLLAPVRVHPPALAGREQEEVEAEGGDAQPAAQRHEALARVEVEVREGGSGLHGPGA